MGISLLLLAYREGENLKWLLPQIKEALAQTGEEYEIIVVDTQLPLDNTPAVCAKNAVRYVRRDRPEFGAAMRKGIACARMDKLLIMDADGSHRPEYIPQLHCRFLQGADVVIGSRYTDGGASNDARTSVFLSKLLGVIYRLFLGLKAQDISTDFRMYDAAQLKAAHPQADHFDIVPEILVRMKINNPGLRIAEIPITFEKRVYGETKRSMPKFIAGYLKTLTKLTILRISGAYGFAPSREVM